MSPPDRRVSISTTSSGLTLSSEATRFTSDGVKVLRCVSPSKASALKPCFMERKLKKSLRWALVVATFTMRQFFKMYSGFDPVHGIAHQTHALAGVESFDGLHQAHIAFLDEVGMGQTVAQVLTGNRHHQTQVRKH